MKRVWFFMSVIILGACTPDINTDFSKKVNPFIGTGGHGHTFPGATLPFGMVQLSPDTRVYGWDACSGYHYSDSTILGFSHTHLSGTGAADYGDILFTPKVNPADSLPIGFSHENEKAWAGYYNVNLENGIDVELTTTKRVGIHQYTFNKDNRAYLNINLIHGIGPDNPFEMNWSQLTNTEIIGYRRSTGWAKDQIVHFTAQFSEPFQILNGADSTNVTIEFGPLDKPLIVKVGLSSVSADNAKMNLDKEASGWSFENYVKNAEQEWNKALNSIDAKFLSNEDETVFYTALYHSLVAPNIISDVNGEYRGIDRQVHKSEKNHYTVFSLWDTFRATHPLFTIINPDEDVEMINTMLNMYDQHGLLPVWELAGNETGTMIGYHSIPVIVDAMAKDMKGFDYEKALEAMMASANEDHLGLKYYKHMGYIPAQREHESVSKTLEYAYDDWCIAKAAEIVGNQEVRDEFLIRSQYYKNLYDPSTGFMRPRRNGKWMTSFDPFEVSGNYTEANAWQYNLFIPHDISSLDEFYGSEMALTHKLDSLFTAKSSISGRSQPDIAGMIGQYAHGNEPSHNFAYLYNFTDQPWKTQELIHKITNDLYFNATDGLSGNEDCGQMSSWYILSALGFYPVTPGIPEYAIGSPKVESATINLQDGNKFIIQTKNLSDENYYIQSITLNGNELNRSYLYHNEIMDGGEIVFIMGNTPAEKWNGKEIESPKTSVDGDKLTITPLINGKEMTFLDTIGISLSSTQNNVKIYYTLDGSTPGKDSKEYTSEFVLDSTTVVKAIAFKEGEFPSKIAEATYIKIPYGRSIELKNQYSHYYTGNSRMALIDHIKGGTNYRDGWQGFQEVDLDAVVDLGKVRRVDEVKVGFLQDNYSWIFYPSELIVELSLDGKKYTHKKTIPNKVNSKEGGLITQDLSTTYPGIRARYVRVIGKNMGKCPDWHKGAGGKAWLFADEISIKTK